MHVKSSLPKNFTHHEQKYFNGVQGSKHKRRLRRLRQQNGGVAAALLRGSWRRQKDMINGPQNPGHE